MGTSPAFVGLSTNANAPPLSAASLNTAFTTKCDSNATTNVANASAYAINGITVFATPGVGGGIYSNIAIGNLVLAAVTTANDNVGVGNNTLASLTTGVNNTAVGYNSLMSLTTGNNNISVGINSLGSLTTGINNVALGVNTQLIATTGSWNVGVGTGVLQALTTGSYNVKIGTSNGTLTDTLATGSYNILIGGGTSIDTPTSSTSNFMNIGQVLYATGINGNGTLTPRVGINQSSPQYALDVVGGINSTGVTSLGEGSIAATGTIQTTAATITTSVARITIANNSGLGVIMPPTIANGSAYFLYAYGTNSCKLYPPSNNMFNGGSVNVPVTIAGNTGLIAVYTDSGNWFTK